MKRHLQRKASPTPAFTRSLGRWRDLRRRVVVGEEAKALAEPWAAGRSAHASDREAEECGCLEEARRLGRQQRHVERLPATR